MKPNKQTNQYTGEFVYRNTNVNEIKTIQSIIQTKYQLINQSVGSLEFLQISKNLRIVIHLVLFLAQFFWGTGPIVLLLLLIRPRELCLKVLAQPCVILSRVILLVGVLVVGSILLESRLVIGAFVVLFFVWPIFSINLHELRLVPYVAVGSLAFFVLVTQPFNKKKMYLYSCPTYSGTMSIFWPTT